MTIISSEVLGPDVSKFLTEFVQVRDSVLGMSLNEIRTTFAAYFTTPVDKRTPIYKVVDAIAETVPVRIYYPSSDESLPVVVFYHGGGWVFGGIEEYDELLRRLAILSSCIFVSVGYRLAPEYPFPKPLQDCFTALSWVKQQYPSHRILVAGDSAGGNLAASVALKAGNSLVGQCLIYPVITSELNPDVYEQSPDKWNITYDAMQFVWWMYAPNEADRKNPQVSLDLATIPHELAPALIITMEYDALHKEGMVYGEKLKQAGIQVQHHQFKNVPHALFSIPFDFKEKTEALKVLAEKLKRLSYGA